MPESTPSSWQRLRAILDRFGLYAPGNAEDDPGFRTEILRATASGMRLASLLAMLGPTFVIALYSRAVLV